MNGPALAAMRRRLSAWYQRARRDMPWRRTRDPYRVWLSEIMLQQTQVATVTPYYERFVRRFPRIGDLAAAPREQVLRLWSGLGYYARARNLHAAAREVVSMHGSRFPDTVDELLALPGIGRYTAGAIASICFGRRAPILDGNVARVLSRLFAIRTPLKQPATQRKLWELAERALPRRGCGDFNQALMELGATVCTPAAPRCEECPVSRQCAARRAGIVDALPARGNRQAVRTVRHVALSIEQTGRRLFETRAEKGLWGGLWHLPSVELREGESARGAARRLADATSRRMVAATAQGTGLRAGHGGRIKVGQKPAAEVRWKLTHRDVIFIVFCARMAGRARRGPSTESFNGSEALRWASPTELAGAPLSTAMRRVLEALPASLPLTNRKRNTVGK